MIQYTHVYVPILNILNMKLLSEGPPCRAQPEAWGHDHALGRVRQRQGAICCVPWQLGSPAPVLAGCFACTSMGTGDSMKGRQHGLWCSRQA